MKTSKYLGMKSGSWECTHIGVARVQPALTHFVADNGRKYRSKRPGHQTYYYIFERMTSDNKAMKMIRLSAAQASKVWKGLSTVEEIAEMKTAQRSQAFKDKVSYSFCD